MAKIKICGLSRLEDIEMANELKPDFVGFVFCPSKRRVDAAKAKELCARLDPGIKRVGVFVNQKKSEVQKIADECALDIIQLHGTEKPADCFFEHHQVWKAIRVKDDYDLCVMEHFRVNRFVLDTFSKYSYGGTGDVFDWEILRTFKKKSEVVLAGGLNPGNIAQAIDIASPYAVDVSSGVETGGKKDYKLVREFICKVREKDDN